jgi:hypothetical protein
MNDKKKRGEKMDVPGSLYATRVGLNLWLRLTTAVGVRGAKHASISFSLKFDRGCQGSLSLSLSFRDTSDAPAPAHAHTRTYISENRL